MKSMIGRTALAVLLSAAVLAGCNASDKTTESTGKIAKKWVASPTPTLSPTPSPKPEVEETEASETEAVAEPTEIPVITPDEFVQDDPFNTLCKDLASQGDDKVQYSYFTSADNGKYKTLLTKSGKKVSRYCMSGGALVMLDEDYDIDPSCMFWLSRDEFTALPFFINLSKDGLVHYKAEGDLTFSQEAADGTYFGEVLGFDEEGNKILMIIGNGVYIENDTIASFKEGDSIGFKDYKVTSVTDGVVTVNDTFTFSEEYCPNTGKSLLVDAAGKPVTDGCNLTLLTVWGGCTVYSGNLPARFPDDYGVYQGIEPSGSYILRSFFYYLTLSKDHIKPYEGWYHTDGLTCPVVIYDGDVSAVTFDIR